jgi:hypothetical protein
MCHSLGMLQGQVGQAASIVGSRRFLIFALTLLLTQMLGGGNCANALTGASRLGLRTALITKVGGDGIGDTLIKVITGLIKTLSTAVCVWHPLFAQHDHALPFFLGVER